LATPKHGFTIMNRLSMDNLTEPITKDLDFQLQDPFLLYRNARYHSNLEGLTANPSNNTEERLQENRSQFRQCIESCTVRKAKKYTERI
ncbi:hypothetical protein NFI96_008488, partial [Prochilodus magdalenae]